MTARHVLLTAHILFAIVTIGWLLTQSMVVPRAIRSGNAGAVRFGAEAASKIGPAAAVVFLLGLGLVARAKDDWANWDDMWVNASMLLFIVAMVNGSVFIARAERAAADKLEAGQTALDEAKRVSMLAGINMLLLIAIVYLMVAKPGWAS